MALENIDYYRNLIIENIFQTICQISDVYRSIFETDF